MKKNTTKSKESQGLTKSQQAREELVQYLSQKKNNDHPHVKDKRKLVRILHNHHVADENILEELHQNESDYLERISSLKAYQSMTKQTQKDKLFQTEWLDEQHRLQDLAFKTEQSLTELFQTLLLQDVSMGGAINELLNLKEHQQKDRQEMRTLYNQQLKDIKSMLRDFNKQNEDNKDSTDVNESKAEEQQMIVSSLFAELLMKLRFDFQTKALALEQEELSLDKEVKQYYAQVQSSVHHELLRQQDQRMQEHLLSIFAEIDVRDIIEFNQTLQELEPIALTSPSHHHQQQKKQKSSKDTDLLLPTFPAEELVDTFLMGFPSPRKATTTNLSESFALGTSSPHPVVTLPPQGSPRSPRTERSVSPSQQMRSTVLNLINTITKNRTKKGSTTTSASPASEAEIEKEREQKLHLLLFDTDIAPIVYQSLYQIYSLDQEYKEQLQQKGVEKQLLCEELGIATTAADSSSGMADLLTPRDLPASSSQPQLETNATGTATTTSVVYGNFPHQLAHDIFVKIYRKAEVTGMNRKTMLELLVTELSPYHLTSSDILLHEQWYRKMKVLQQKYKQLEQQYLVQRHECIDKMKTEIRQTLTEKKAKIQAQQELWQLTAKRQVLYEELERMKQLRDAKQQQELQAKLSAAQALAEREEQQALLRQQERDRQRQLLQQYHQERLALQRQQQQALAQQKQQEEAKLKQLIAANKSKVEFRQQKFVEKQQQKKLLEEQAQLEEQKKLELLNRLAEQAPYWDQIKDIASRLDHATVSSQAQAFIKDEEEHTRGHLPLNGFTDQRVIRDTRFRIMEALRMAGLAQSQAAREVVAQYHPRPHLAIHGLF